MLYAKEHADNVTKAVRSSAEFAVLTDSRRPG